MTTEVNKTTKSYEILWDTFEAGVYVIDSSPIYNWIVLQPIGQTLNRFLSWQLSVLRFLLKYIVTQPIRDGQDLIQGTFPTTIAVTLSAPSLYIKLG